jgi:hypothetical protein
MDAFSSELLAHLQATAFRDLAGSRLSTRIPVSRALLNMVIAHALQGRGGPVKAVDVQPHDGDRLDATVTVTYPFVPALTVGVTVERQPQFPESPILVLHWSLLGGLGAIASRFIQGLGHLPPGIRLEGQFVVLDIPVLAAGSPLAAALPYIRNLQVHTVEDRIVLEADLEVHENPATGG